MNPVFRRLTAIELLVAIAVLLVSSPFIDRLRLGPLIESILLTFVLFSAVLSIAAERKTLIIALILAIPAIIGRWIHLYRPDLFPAEVFLVAEIVFVLFVIVNLLQFVLAAKHVDTDVLCAGTSAYLLLGLLWTFAYWLVNDRVPGAFAFGSATGADASIEGFNGLYFSFITLSTVGYGDITPVNKVARMLAAAESTTGLLYVAILIARLVAIYSTPTADRE